MAQKLNKCAILSYPCHPLYWFHIFKLCLFRKERDDFIIATKCRHVVNFDDIHIPNKQGLCRRTIIKALNDSLERLQTDYVDLYQVSDSFLHIAGQGEGLVEFGDGAYVSL